MEKIDQAINKIQENGYLVSSGAIDRIKELEDHNTVLDSIIERLKDSDFSEGFIEAEDIDELLDQEKEVEIQGSLYTPLAKEHEAKIDILDKDLTKQSESTGKVKDFVENFKSRYHKIHNILKDRGENSAIQIENVKDKKNENVKVIGLLAEEKTTKNNHIFMKIEDPTGIMKALIPSGNKETKRKMENIIDDEVIALDGKMSNNDLFIVNDVHYPDTPIKEVETTEEDLAIVTTSDIHLGSKHFLEKNFKSFIEWLKGKKGNKKQKELAEKVKYITIAGDLAEGVGVYPDQEQELEITDIYGQYKKIGEYLEQIPSHIEIIIGTGNHDAANKADPQPKLDPVIAGRISELDNVTLVGSPSTFKLHGLKTLMYHGTSFDDIIAQMPKANHEKVKEIMEKTLKCRHVHPIYGEKPITPEREDHLVIEEVPDIYHTGHIHRNDYTKYKGTICVNSGTWQKTTPYQKKLGHTPTPGKLPVIETKKGKINVLRFDKGLE